MCATVSVDSVQIATRDPSRAAAYAASHPACPAPTTITSKRSFMSRSTHRPRTARITHDWKSSRNDDLPRKHENTKMVHKKSRRELVEGSKGRRARRLAY